MDVHQSVANDPIGRRSVEVIRVSARVRDGNAGAPCLPRLRPEVDDETAR
jgi:hypothetical protein